MIPLEDAYNKTIMSMPADVDYLIALNNLLVVIVYLFCTDSPHL